MKYDIKILDKLKYLEDLIYFDGVLNIASLLFDIKQISRLENIKQIGKVGKELSKLWLELYKSDSETLYVSKSKKELKIGVYYDLKNHNANYLWKLLWYPKCCIKKFVDNWWIDNINFFKFLLKKVDKKDRSSSYLNIFEDKLIYHVPCSMGCEKSIFIGKKVLELFLLLNKNKDMKYLFKEKKYILFNDFEWIKISNNNYSYWSIFSSWNNEIIKKVKKWYKISIIWNEKIEIYKNWYEKQLINDFIVFNFIK